MKTRKEALLSVFGMARRANVLQIGQDIVKSSLARGESLRCFLQEKGNRLSTGPSRMGGLQKKARSLFCRIFPEANSLRLSVQEM